MSETLAAPERPGGPPPAPPAPPAPAERGGPDRPGRLLAAAAAAGLLAALALPGERPGLGVLLVALAVAAATWAARASAAAPAARESAAAPAARASASPHWPRVWGTLAILCAAVAVLRDASWVVWPAIAGSVALGSLAVAGGTTWWSLARGLVAGPAAAPAGAGALARAAAGALPSRSGAHAAPVLRGAAIAVALLAVFGGLFATGDRAFAQLAEDSLPSDVRLGLLPGRVLAFGLVAALVAGLVLARRGAAREAAAPRRLLGTAEWAIPLVALDLLFAAFVAVQFTVLFGGDARVLETTGLTYAEYAREGYGQLLVAAALTLAVAGAALRYAAAERRRLLRALLALLCLLTGVVLASALHRLDLYQDAFGATRLRLTATATLLWLGAVIALVLAALAADRHAFLPRASLLVTALAGLGFALYNPDLRIAERNLARDEVDRAYLRTLSADARAALPARLERPVGDDGWGGWNLARR